MSQTSTVQVMIVCLFSFVVISSPAPSSIVEQGDFKINEFERNQIIPLFDTVPLIESLQRAKIGNSKRYDELIRYDAMLTNLENRLANRVVQSNSEGMRSKFKMPRISAKDTRRINQLPKRDAGQICIWKVCPPSPWRRLY